MAKKYYAVARGKTPGIYFTWDDCKVQVDGFPGAKYKSFPTVVEAQEFIESATGRYEEERQPDEQQALDWMEEKPVESVDGLVAYVDGSYDHSQLRYAYGCVMVLPDEEVTLSGSDNDEEYVSMRNVAGEILGSEKAVLWAIEHGYKKVTIYYDYEGIEKWANHLWKANKTGTQRYQAFIDEKRKEIEICFEKVIAHTGVKYNEMADGLAKEALGIE
ncbi:MAG: reverse transcriptase-like protein [Lachnospiraceae bacterium]|nr:reverse transcriptase-like protein [Lachnospiraceae bacterium]